LNGLIAMRLFKVACAVLVLLGCGASTRREPEQCLVSISAYDPVSGALLSPPYQVAPGGRIQFAANFAPCKN